MYGRNGNRNKAHFVLRFDTLLGISCTLFQLDIRQLGA